MSVPNSSQASSFVPSPDHRKDRPRLVVCISGSGTTLQNIVDRIADGMLPAEIVQVISSKADVFGVERAKQAHLPVTIIERTPKNDFSERVFAAIRPTKPDLVILGGWLHLLKIPEDFRFRVLNIHPALLPSFGGKGMYGRHVHEAVLDWGARVSGCTVHFVDDAYDNGPVIAQTAIPIFDDDTPDTLAARVFAAECEAYPEAIRFIASGKWRMLGRRVVKN